MRDILSIPCQNDIVLATIDGPADAAIGWLFVTGGSQTRVGPHRLYERLAQRLADAGHAVIRFDRRGVGDSSGIDRSYIASAPEIAAAAAALRCYAPALNEMIGFGLCDGATALALYGAGAGISRRVLANPWAVEPRDALPPAAAIRGHYRKRLVDPQAWVRLLRGRVNLGKLLRGIFRSGAREDDGLVRRIAAGLRAEDQILLAEGDGTALAFADAWDKLDPAPPAAAIVRIRTSSHSFAPPAAFTALADAMQDAAIRRR